MASDNELLIKVKAETSKATKEIGRLTKEVDKLSKQTKKTSKNTDAINKSFTGINKITKSLTSSLAKLGTAYLSFQGAKQLITTTAELEKGFIEVSKTTGITGDALKELEDDIFDLATSMAGVSIEELQGVAATAGQLGIQGSKDILEFTRVITMMGTATDLTAEQAAEAMAGLGKSLGVPIEEFERLGSTIDKVSDNSNASAANLVEYAQRIAGVGKTFGLTADEVIAFGATLKDVGISAELGGTALGKVMLEMLKDTEAFAKASGVSFDEFSDLVQNEPVKALETFISALGKLDKSARIKALDDLGLKSSGVTQTMLKLADATDTLSKNLNTANTEWKTNTALMKSYTTASSGFDAQMETLKNQIKELGYKIGKDLLPPLAEVAKQTGNFIESMDLSRIKAFTTYIGDTVTMISKLKEAYNNLPDFDWLPKNVTPSITPGPSIGEALDLYSELKIRYEEMFSASQQLEEQTLKTNLALAGSGGVFVGTAEDMETLKKNILSLIEENNKLIQQWTDKSPTIFKDKIEELQGKVGELADAYSSLDEGAIVFEKIAKATKKTAEETEKLNKQRIKNTEKTLTSLEKSEQKLAKDIVGINKKLIAELANIANERFKMNQDIESRIAELKRGALSDDAAYYDRQKEAEKALADAKIAIKAGEFEKYKYYINQYESLVTDSAGKEIKINDKVAVSADETRQRAIDGLKNIQQLENVYLDEKEAASKLVLQQKQLELDATIALMEAQRASLLLMKQLAEELTGNKLDIDTSAVDMAIEKAKALRLDLDNIKNTPATIKTDTTQIDIAKQKIEEIKTLTINGTTLEVDADTTAADFGIKKLITKTNGDEITMDVNPEYAEAEKTLKEFRENESNTTLHTEVLVDTKKAEASLSKLAKPTKSEHKVNPNTTQAQSAIDKLKQPTSSVHTVYERVVPARANGGLIPTQKLATVPAYARGGVFRGSGKVPGDDPTNSDDVNAVLTGGEFVIKRSAVKKIGLPTLRGLNAIVDSSAIKSFKMPKIKGYAEGGLVGGSSSTQTTITPAQTPINLNIGGQSFKVMSDLDVAEALTRHIDTQGGF